ncbi:hypothetical protein D3C85_1104230 [compost metagenome]
MWTGSTHTASCAKSPNAGRLGALLASTQGLAGLHSQTMPLAYSSHDSQVFQGVGPPAQFVVVPFRIGYESTTVPFLSKRNAPTPPPFALISELLT